MMSGVLGVSVCMLVGVCVCVLMCPFSVGVSLYLSISVSVSLSVCVSVCLCLSVSLCVCVSVSRCLCVSMCVCGSLCVFVSLCVTDKVRREHYISLSTKKECNPHPFYMQGLPLLEKRLQSPLPSLKRCCPLLKGGSSLRRMPAAVQSLSFSLWK